MPPTRSNTTPARYSVFRDNTYTRVPIDSHSSSTSEPSNVTKQMTQIELAPDGYDPRTASQQSESAAGSADSHSHTAPVKQVIDVFELCEQILIMADLTCVELGRARRVCRQVCAVIDNSSTLRKDLYLQARMDDSIAARNEFMLARGDQARRLIAKTASSHKPARKVTLHELHPAMEVSNYNLSKGLVDRVGRMPDYTMLCFTNKTRISQIPRDSAFNDMYICQPPTENIGVMFNGGRHSLCRVREVHNDDGGTFGFLMDTVKQFINDNKDAEPYVHHVYIYDGFALTTAEMRALNVTGTITSNNDPNISAVGRKEQEKSCERQTGKGVFSLE